MSKSKKKVKSSVCPENNIYVGEEKNNRFYSQIYPGKTFLTPQKGKHYKTVIENTINQKKYLFNKTDTRKSQTLRSSSNSAKKPPNYKSNNYKSAGKLPSFKSPSSFDSSKEALANYYEGLYKKERDKNKEYNNQILALKEKIQILENQLEVSKQMFFEKNFDSLKQENNYLNNFKDNVYKISGDYDLVNSTIIESLRKIENVFKDLNSKESKLSLNYKIENLGNVKNDFETIINRFLDMLNIKQREYNHLLKNKDFEIQTLKAENEKLKNIVWKKQTDEIDKEYINDANINNDKSIQNGTDDSTDGDPNLLKK